ncbi:MAG: hypothetical protein EDQ89_06925 [Acidobacteria bacterium]|nr:MAG: hypothetical protein EDQ89_06925 [Acidobacteriota bacterium]
MRYPVETFSDEERLLLEPHFSNLDRPVFTLTNLPETVKGALFARYSRYQGTLRRLYLDEFAADVPAGGRPFDGAAGERAAQLYERVFIGYGDDSVAQLGGAHLACEWVSNVLTKVLQRGRLAAYLEQSTRYIPYDAPIEPGAEPGSPGSWRYWRDEELGPAFGRAMDEIFTIYSRTLAGVGAWAERRWPRGEEPRAAWERSIRAKALDLLRGLLPAATLSHVGIYASGQAYEQLLLRLAASPLPEARAVGAMAHEELAAVIPSFISRVGRPERGGEWISYLERRREATERWVARLGLDRREGPDAPAVELVHVDGDEDLLLAASLYEATGLPEAEVTRRIGALDPIEREQILAELADGRGNRRHRPGRGWEAELAIAYNELVPVEALLAAVGEFYAAGHPTRIKLQAEVLGGPWDALVAQRADVALTEIFGDGSALEIAHRPLGAVEFVFAIAPSHPLAAEKEPLKASTIRRHRVVVAADSSRGLPARSSGIAAAADVLTVGSLAAKLAAHVAGLGVGFLPRALAAPAIAAGRLVERRVSAPKPRVALAVAWRTPDAGPACRWFVERLQRLDLGSG